MAIQSQGLISKEPVFSGKNTACSINFAPEEGALKGSRLQETWYRYYISCKIRGYSSSRNYSWGSAVLAFLYREVCNASEKAKGAIGGALQLVQIWAWSRIIPLCSGLGAPRVHMSPHQIDNNRVLLGAPYGAMWNYVDGYHQLVAQLEHEVQIIAEAIKHQPQQTATPFDSAPTTCHRQRRSSSQMSIGSVKRGDIGMDIAGPSTAYTPQDYYVPQPP
ncbi:UNVERIFIED_CONTAM: protein MAINTENANCE OF MERISTEMS [Sesamum angustifolium]|uniref:Protein MAINTENANCE OF MERISTEMS n=1 Tax=Sesamum angustifolium TaxID=2727405 RepID=A0AAW2PFH6_9LAMI